MQFCNQKVPADLRHAPPQKNNSKKQENEETYLLSFK